MNYRLGYEWETYRKNIESGKWQMHAFTHGFLVTEVVKYVEETVCIVHLIGGEKFEDWKGEANEKLKGFAKDKGCKAIEAICRLGLENKLKPLGWRRNRVVMRMDL